MSTVASAQDAPSTLIRNATLYTPDGPVEGDCLIRHGRIAELGEVSTDEADVVIDAQGLWLWPGAFDAHVHFREPGLTHKEDWSTASRAAVAGGVTCAFDMPNTKPSTISPERLEAKYQLIGESSLINYGLFFGANPINLEACLEAKPDVCGLKIFMASSTGDLLVDKEEDLDRIFASYDGQISVHAEDEQRLLARAEEYAGSSDPATHSVIRDPEAARLGIEMACKLANKYGRRLHVLHVSSRAEIEALRRGREVAQRESTGARITAEACPHHLFFSTDDYEEWGVHVKMNPPLRSEEDRLAMWDALHAGDLQMIATDHAPHLPEEKALGYPDAPSGVPGVQTMVPLMLGAMHEGKCRPEQLVEWMCHAPGRIYAVDGRGRLEQGMWADVVLIDPEMERPITDEDQHSRCGWTPYAGRMVKGWPVATFVNGVQVFRRAEDGSPQILMDEEADEVPGMRAQFISGE